MMHLAAGFLGTVVAVLAAAEFVPGFVVSDFTVAAFVAVLLGIIGVTLRPVLLLLTLPINLMTFGVFSFVINAGILLVVAQFVDGFDIAGFVPALLGGLVIAVIQWLVHRFV
jgi:putative membrane protein